MNFSRKQLMQFMQDNNVDNNEKSIFTDDEIREMMESTSKHISCKNGKNGESIDDIIIEIDTTLRKVLNSNEEIEEMKDRLIGYKVIHNEEEFELSKYIRWLRLNTGPPYKLTNGGILMGVNKTENGNLQVLCKNNKRMFTKYNFRDCVTFQKMTDDELLILQAMKMCC